MTIDKGKRTRLLCKLGLTMFLFVLCVCFIEELSLPIILMDEFGYWSNAAFFSGLDWSGVAQYNFYYSYGYSFLQAMLMRLIGNAAVLYRGMIVLNAILVCCSFWIADAVMSRLLGTNSKLTIGIAFLTACYPTNLSNAHIAWPECLLVFLCWLSTFVLLRYLEKQRIHWIVLWTVIVLYAYTVHQRCLALVLAGVIVCIVGCVTKKISWKHAAIFFALAVVLFVGATFLKGIVKENVILSGINSDANINDYGSIFTYVLDNFNLEGALKLLTSIAGKVFCLMITSLLLWGIGFFYAMGKTIQTLSLALKRKNVHANALLAVYVVAFSVMSILIASIFTLDPAQIDVLVYGRYTEWCIGPVVAFGAAALFKSKRPNKYLVSQAVVLVALTATISCVYAIKGRGMTTFRWVCSAVLAFFYEIVPNKVMYVWVAAGTVLLIVAIFGLIFGQEKITKNKKETIVILISCILSILLGVYAVGRARGSNYRREDLLQQQEMIEVVDPDAPIMFLAEGNGDQPLWYAASLQFLNRNNSVEMLDLSKKQEENYFFLCKGKDTAVKDIEGTKLQLFKNSITELYYIVVDDETLPVVEQTLLSIEQDELTLPEMSLSEGGKIEKLSKNGQWETIYTEGVQKKESEKTRNLSVDKSSTYAIVTTDQFLEGGQYVVYGPGITLSPGSYRVTFTLELLAGGDITGGELGLCDIGINGGQRVLMTAPLTVRQFAGGGPQTISLDFSTSMEESLTGVEFRLYVEPGVQFRVTDISYQCTGLERQAILPGTEDYSMLLSVLGYDTESLPLQIAVDDAMLPYVSCSQLQEELGRAHEVSLVGISEMVVPETPTILLVPADETELLFDLLPRDTVLVRLNEYAVVVPSGYSIERNFVEAGGRTLSDGDRLNVRYFQGTGKSNFGSINATIPAGEYDLSYRVDVLGTPLWGDLGTLSIRGGGVNVSESLSPDMFTYGVYEGSRALTMEDSGQLSMQLTTRSGITVTRMEAYLSRRG